MKAGTLIMILLVGMGAMGIGYLWLGNDRTAPAGGPARTTDAERLTDVSRTSGPAMDGGRETPYGRAEANQNSNTAAGEAVLRAKAPATSPVEGAGVTTPADPAWVEARVEVLWDLSLDEDPASLQIILAELKNPSRAIRLAAIEATKEFGSRDAIPALKEAAETAEELDEKAAMLEAAEFLELPSLTEVRDRLREQRESQAPK